MPKKNKKCNTLIRIFRVSGDERSDDNRHDQFGHFFYRFLGLNICIYVIVNGTTNTFPTTTQSKNYLTL